MGQSSIAVLFSERRPKDVPNDVRELAGLFGATRALTASAAKAPVRNYEDFQRFLRDDTFDLPDDYPVFVQDPTLDQAINMTGTHPGGRIWLRVANGRSKVLYDAVKRDIPASIAGWAEVSCPTIVVGGYDWFDQELEGAPEGYFGRSEIALELVGNGVPDKPEEFKRLLWEIPEFKQLQQDVEQIIGPAKRCIFWSV